MHQHNRLAIRLLHLPSQTSDWVTLALHRVFVRSFNFLMFSLMASKALGHPQWVPMAALKLTKQAFFCVVCLRYRGALDTLCVRLFGDAKGHNGPRAGVCFSFHSGRGEVPPKPTPPSRSKSGEKQSFSNVFHLPCAFGAPGHWVIPLFPHALCVADTMSQRLISALFSSQVHRAPMQNPKTLRSRISVFVFKTDGLGRKYKRHAMLFSALQSQICVSLEDKQQKAAAESAP